jgi:integrase
LTINKQLHYIDGEELISEPKTANAIRTVALPKQTVYLLIAEHNKHPESPLMFCSPKTMGYWHPNSIVNLHRRILMTAGIEESVRFHDLRHVNAAVMVRLGVESRYEQERNGWSSVRMYKQVYAYTMHDKMDAVDESINTYFANKIAK